VTSGCPCSPFQPSKPDERTLVHLIILIAPFGADAQQPGKIPRIGYLAQFSGAAGPPSGSLTAFLEGLKELGYVEGKNIAIEYRFTEGKNDRLPALAAELGQMKVDLIVTETGGAALQAKKVTQTIPIVMEVSGDAVGQGLVASLAHPGGNVTGLTALSPGTAGKRMQLLAEVVPKLTRAGVLWGGAGFPVTERELAETRAAAQPLNVQVSLFEVRSAADLPGAFAEAVRQNIQALLLFDMPYLAIRSTAAQIGELSTQNRMPMMFQATLFVQEGGLISYGVNVPELSRKAATYVDRILKGANPADLPVEQPTKFMLVINMKTAKTLNLTIPQSVLSQANQVIE
jgi:putative tryptophan/tyrosine transport system substrate-binding protein